MSPNSLLPIIGTILYIPWVFAAPIQAGPVAVGVSLSETSIVAGQPVDIVFVIQNTGTATIAVSLYNNFQYSKDMLILALQNKRGEVIKLEKRDLLAYPARQTRIITATLSPGEKVLGTYPLHLQYSTDLSPGAYKIVVEKVHLTGSIAGVQKDLDLETPIPPIDLAVRPADSKVLHEVYASLLRSSLDKYNEANATWNGIGRQDFLIPPCIKALLWAWGKAAVPYQVDYIFPQDAYPRAWETSTVHAYQNIVQFGDMASVQRLVKVALDPNFHYDLAKGRYSDPGLVWALQQFHAEGNSDIVAITQPVIDRFPKAIDIKRAVESAIYWD